MSEFYFRYRPFNTLIKKEIKYNEIYFASRNECNDPFETDNYLEFEKDEEKWFNTVLMILDEVYKGIGIKNKINLKQYLDYNELKKYCKVFSNYLNEISPLNQTQINNIDLPIHLISKFKKDHPNMDNKEETIVIELVTGLIIKLRSYMDYNYYFASFSKTCNNELMWSHYANNHSGVCCIFRTKDNKVQFDNINKAFDIKEGLLYDTNYVNEPNHYSAFYYFFPFSFFNMKMHDEKFRETESYQTESSKVSKFLNNIALEKDKIWEYEQESRLIIRTDNKAWILENELSSVNRTRNYEESQLAGIILGLETSNETKAEVLELLKEKMIDERIDRIILDGNKHCFVLFQCFKNPSKKKILIKPVALIKENGVIFPKDEFFNQYLMEWSESNIFWD